MKEARAISTRDGEHLVIACRGVAALLLRRPRDGSYRLAALPDQTVCEGLARGPGGNLWFTFTGPGGHGVGILDPASLATDVHLLPPPPEGATPRRLGALALGPDRKSMWICDRGGRICRVRLEQGVLALREYALPEGDQPLTIVPFPGERMLFTVHGRSRIGSVKAVESPAERKARAAARTERAPVEAKAPKPRERAPEEKVQKPEARGPAPLETKAASPTAGPGAPAPRKEDRCPQALLRALGVILDTGARRHILNGHGYDRNPLKSQFAPAHSSPEAITRAPGPGA